MKLVLVILLQTCLIKNAQLGLVRNFFGTVAEELNKVKEDINSIVSNKHYNGDTETKGKERFFNNMGDSFKQSIESVNEHVDDSFVVRDQSDSEAYGHSRRDEQSGWSRNTFRSKTNGAETQEHNGHTHFHNHDCKQQYIGGSEEKYSESVLEYNTPKTYANSWDNDKNFEGVKEFSTSKSYTTESTEYNNGQKRNKLTTTPKTSSFEDSYSNTNIQGFNVNQKEETKDTAGSDNGVIITNDNNITSIDQIVFPGKVNSSTEKTCPEGLIITANGGCLEPIVIHVNNTNNNQSIGVHRSAFVADCLAGYSKTIDGQCAEIIYD